MDSITTLAVTFKFHSGFFLLIDGFKIKTSFSRLFGTFKQLLYTVKGEDLPAIHHAGTKGE